jgi:hypothetical protein
MPLFGGVYELLDDKKTRADVATDLKVSAARRVRHSDSVPADSSANAPLLAALRAQTICAGGGRFSPRPPSVVHHRCREVFAARKKGLPARRR